MSKPAQNKHRTFEQLSPDERLIVLGHLAKKICIREISELTNNHHVVIAYWFEDLLRKELRGTSPKKLEVIIKANRKIELSK